MSRYPKHEAYTLYEKRGRRYHPVKEYDPKIMDAFPDGFTLIHSRPGCTSYRYGVSPAVADVEAALYIVQEAMRERIYQATKYRPEPKPVSEKTRALWKQLEQALNEEDGGFEGRLLQLWGCSTQDVIDAGIDAIRQYIKEKREEPDGRTGTAGE